MRKKVATNRGDDSEAYGARECAWAHFFFWNITRDSRPKPVGCPVKAQLYPSPSAKRLSPAAIALAALAAGFLSGFEDGGDHLSQHGALVGRRLAMRPQVGPCAPLDVLRPSLPLAVRPVHEGGL